MNSSQSFLNIYVKPRVIRTPWASPCQQRENINEKNLNREIIFRLKEIYSLFLVIINTPYE